MGWFGYGIYDGDDTQTRHYDFIKWAGVKVGDDKISEWLHSRGTKIPNEYIETFVKGLPKVIKKMPKTRFWNEDNALEWQMLGALCFYNNIGDRETIFKCLEATDYLIQSEHTEDFNMPRLRMAALKRFKKKIYNNYYIKVI